MGVPHWKTVIPRRADGEEPSNSGRIFSEVRRSARDELINCPRPSSLDLAKLTFLKNSLFPELTIRLC